MDDPYAVFSSPINATPSGTAITPQNDDPYAAFSSPDPESRKDAAEPPAGWIEAYKHAIAGRGMYSASPELPTSYRANQTGVVMDPEELARDAWIASQQRQVETRARAARDAGYAQRSRVGRAAEYAGGLATASLVGAEKQWREIGAAVQQGGVPSLLGVVAGNEFRQNPDYAPTAEAYASKITGVAPKDVLAAIRTGEESLDPVSRTVAQIAAMPAGFIEPANIAAMVVAHVPASVLADSAASSAIIAATEKRFGSAAAQAVGIGIHNAATGGAYGAVSSGGDVGSAAQGAALGVILGLPRIARAGLGRNIRPEATPESGPLDLAPPFQETPLERPATPRGAEDRGAIDAEMRRQADEAEAEAAADTSAAPPPPAPLAPGENVRDMVTLQNGTIQEVIEHKGLALVKMPGRNQPAIMPLDALQRVVPHDPTASVPLADAVTPPIPVVKEPEPAESAGSAPLPLVPEKGPLLRPESLQPNEKPDPKNLPFSPIASNYPALPLTKGGRPEPVPPEMTGPGRLPKDVAASISEPKVAAGPVNTVRGEKFVPTYRSQPPKVAFDRVAARWEPAKSAAEVASDAKTLAAKGTDVVVDAPADALAAVAGRPVSRLSSVAQWVADRVTGRVNQAMSKITSADREAGEAMVRWGAAKKFIPVAVRNDLIRIFGHVPIEEELNDFGAALTEDALQGTAAKKGGQVASILSPIGRFKTEADVIGYLAGKQSALAAYADIRAKKLEPFFQAATGLNAGEASSMAIPGKYTGQHVNLLAASEETNPIDPSHLPTPGGLAATLKRTPTTALSRTGQAVEYNTNFKDMLTHAYEQTYTEAMKRQAYDALVKGGLAVYDRPTKGLTIGGLPAVGFDIKRQVIVGKGGAFPQHQKIYLRADIANEFRQVFDNRLPDFGALNIGGAGVTTMQMLGLTDLTAHAFNGVGAIATAPGIVSGPGAPLIRATGGQLVVGVVKAMSRIRDFLKNDPETVAQLERLAQVGAYADKRMEGSGPLALSSKAMHALTTGMRLALADAYEHIAETTPGLEVSETGLREFINRRTGNYQRELRNWGDAVFRSAVSPFLVAGKTFNSLGLGLVTGQSGMRGTAGARRSMAIQQTAAVLGGAFVLPAIVNTLTTGSPTGRLGVPFGDVDTGKTRENGAPVTIANPIARLVRRGGRLIGANAMYEGWRRGLTATQIADMAVTDAFTTAMHPYIGPPVQFLGGILTGRDLTTGYPLPGASPEPGRSTMKARLVASTAKLNPLVTSVANLVRTAAGQSALSSTATTPGEVMGDIGNALVSGFTPPLHSTPARAASQSARITGAQLNDWLDQLRHEARDVPVAGGKRAAYIVQKIRGIDDPAIRGKAMSKLSKEWGKWLRD